MDISIDDLVENAGRMYSTCIVLFLQDATVEDALEGKTRSMLISSSHP